MVFLKRIIVTDSAPGFRMEYPGCDFVEVKWNPRERHFEWGMYHGDSPDDPEPDCLDSGVSPTAGGAVRRFVGDADGNLCPWIEKVAVGIASEIDRLVGAC